MKKTIIALCLLLNGCGAGDRTVVDNTSNVNCNATIITEIVTPENLSSKMSSLEDVGADVLRYDELPSGSVSITYSLNMCNNNGNVDMSKPQTDISTVTN